MVIIRVSGQFTQILRLWMDKQGIYCPGLRGRIDALARDDSVPVEQWRNLLAEARALTQFPGAGLQIGSQVSLQHVGVLGYLVLNCETLVDALQTYQLSERRFYGVNFCSVTRQDSSLSLTWPDRLGEPNALFVQTAISVLVSFLRQRFPSTLRLHRVALSERRPRDAEPYERFFACPVEFASTTPGITIDYALGSQCEQGPLPRNFLAMQGQQNEAFAGVVAAKTPFFQQLQSVLLKLIPQGTVSLQAVAADMSCSPRTLQRRLNAQHLSYQSLLDGLREQLACRYLLQDNLSFADVTLLLGFSEQSAFNRAFRHWTGTPPGKYRSAHRNNPAVL